MKTRLGKSANLFLIGPMAAGKSSVGRYLAAILSKEFYDSDQEIESKSFASVPVIFAMEGEEGFRARESEMIARLTAMENIVLATGGGAVLSEENQAHLQQRGTIIYIRATAATILLRTAKDKTRPLLQSIDRARNLKRLLKERTPLYEGLADLTFDTDEGIAEQTADAIARAIAQASQ